MMGNRLMDLEVDVATLTRRLDVLEGRVVGRVDALHGPQPLFDLYSHLMMDGIQPGEEIAALLRTCIMIMSPRLLLDLGRMVADPFPWRPFLSAADLLHVAGFDMTESIAWLEQTIALLMKAQGLGVLRIEDVVRAKVGPVHILKSFALSGK